MDSEIKLYLNRAEDEFLLARKDMDISLNLKIKQILGIPKEKTFFNSVITHAYYSIFYTTKAFLLSKGIKTKQPQEHKRTYEEFKRVINNRKLLKVYEIEGIKAETLLNILFIEKRKRGIFTYNIKSEANIPYSKESLNNAKIFILTIKKLLE